MKAGRILRNFYLDSYSQLFSLEERRRKRSPTARNHSVEKPARKAKVDTIDPHRKKKVFPHFRLTTGETIVFNEDIGTFHEVETPENAEKEKFKGIVPDDQRDRAGGKSRENGKQKPVEVDVEVQTVKTYGSCESIRSIQCCEPVPVQDCRPTKKVSYEGRVRCCTYPPPEPIEDECENDFFKKSVNEKPDSDTDCSSSEEEVLRFRTQSECEIQNQMVPLMEKYGAPYIARKVLVIGKKLEKENELLKQKSFRRQLCEYGSNDNIGCRGILKKSRSDTPCEITSPVKCPHCKKKNIINEEHKSGQGRMCNNQQRQFRRCT